MILWIALCTGGAVYLLLIPVTSPESAFFPNSSAGESRQDPASLIARLEEWQYQALVGTGIHVSPRAFLGASLALAAGTGLLVDAFLGPFSGVLGAVGTMLVIREVLIRRQTQRLTLFSTKFREALVALTAALRAGQSLPKALESTVHHLARVSAGAEDPARTELEAVLRELSLGIPLQQALENLKWRVPLEEVAQFVDAANITRRRGGNLTEVMVVVGRLISDRLEIRQEVQVLTAEKRAEGAVISVLPVAVLVLNTLINPDYMSPLLKTNGGQALVGLGLFLIMCSYLAAQAITRIDL